MPNGSRVPSLEVPSDAAELQALRRALQAEKQKLREKLQSASGRDRFWGASGSGGRASGAKGGVLGGGGWSWGKGFGGGWGRKDRAQRDRGERAVGRERAVGGERELWGARESCGGGERAVGGERELWGARELWAEEGERERGREGGREVERREEVLGGGVGAGAKALAADGAKRIRLSWLGVKPDGNPRGPEGSEVEEGEVNG